MTAKGVVVEICGNKAKVKCKRQSACASCHNCEAKGACHAELIFGESSGEVVVDVINTVGAEVGDSVEISASTKNTLVFSLLLFVLPCIFSFLAYNVASSIGASEKGSALTLVLTFALSFFTVGKLLNFVIGKKHTLEISNILGEIEA